MATTEKAVASYAVYAGLRDERKKTDSSVAKILGFGPSTLSDWKAGRYIPKHDKIAAIADLFDVPVEVFYQGETTNEIAIREEPQLPDTIEDLTQFVLVGKANLNAYLLKLQTVNRLSVAQEIRDQTLREAQEISTALIAAEQKIGELLLSIPTASGKRTDLATSSDRKEEVKTKTETVKEMGYSKNDVSDYQQMAQNPEVVQKVIDEAMERGEVVTKASVMREIKFYKDRIATLEKQKTQTVEVVPDDYEELKEQLKTAQAEAKRAKDDFWKIREEQKEQNKKIKTLESQIEEDKRVEDVERDMNYFTNSTHEYIRRFGGHVWTFEHFDAASDEAKKAFIKAIKTLDGFAQQLLKNVGGSLNE